MSAAAASTDDAAVAVHGLRKACGEHEVPRGISSRSLTSADGLQGAPLSERVHLEGENAANLAIWGVAGLIVAQRAFRWMPQGTGAG